MQQRYLNDPTLVDDFVRIVTSNLIDPARRSASATVAQRAGAPLPQDSPSGAVRAGTPVPKMKDLDERAAMGWAMLNQARKP
jgi:hypothetical protein